MNKMKQSHDESLNRFVKRLSNEYDHRSMHEAPQLNFSSMPWSCAPETCSLPSLAISAPLVEMASASSVHPQTTSQQQQYTLQMSRRIQYDQHSISSASFQILRNFISTFGFVLDLQLQRMIFRVMTAKSNSKRKGDEETLQKFTDFSISNSNSVATPQKALTNFSTLLPINHYTDFDDTSYAKVTLCFQAEVTVHIGPNNTTHTSIIRAPGEVNGMFAKKMNRPLSVDIDIDTNILYASMRRECKVIAKRVINAIAGFELMKMKPKNAPQPASSMVCIEKSDYNPHTCHSETGTHKTMVSSVDSRDVHSSPQRVTSKMAMSTIDSRDVLSSPAPPVETSESVVVEENTRIKKSKPKKEKKGIVEKLSPLHEIETEKPKKKKDKKRWKSLLSKSGTAGREVISQDEAFPDIVEVGSSEAEISSLGGVIGQHYSF
mmetsp:Transcript_15585/g.19000  ORF Transcript_15585/g.19000 Transcript_15585/m.19000 type:complete len:434 (+) Transcript_15585:318-1619(+)